MWRNIPGVLILTTACSVAGDTRPLSASERAQAREWYVNRGCIACHQHTQLTQAPALQAVSAKVAATDDGLQSIRDALDSGSRGKWGAAVEMPPQTHLPVAERELLARWIMELHASGEKPPESAATQEELNVRFPMGRAPTLPADPGLFIEKRDGAIIQALDKPVLYRTYLPDAPARAIAVGLPGDLSFGFDAQHCRLLYAWRGGFIDVSRSWKGYGGWYSTLVGEKFYEAPAGFPLRIGDPKSEPTVRFKGYDLVDGVPVFKYQVDGALVRHRITLSEGGEGGPALLHRFTLPDHSPPVYFLDVGKTHRSDDATWADGRWEIHANKRTRFSLRVAP